jgi:DNA mismatch repair protein MutS2
VAIERGGAAVALQAGDLRVVVDIEDLEPPTAGEVAVDRGTGDPRTGRRGDFGAGGRAAATGRPAPVRSGASSARSADRAPVGVAATLDLRGARVDEAMETLDRYIDRASVAGAGRVTIIHGHGTGAMRDAVRAVLANHPMVKDWRPGERGEGGDGATIVTV